MINLELTPNEISLLGTAAVLFSLFAYRSPFKVVFLTFSVIVILRGGGALCLLAIGTWLTPKTAAVTLSFFLDVNF